MKPGTIDLFFLLLALMALQAWWVIPLIMNNKSNKKVNGLEEEIKKLDKLYKE